VRFRVGALLGAPALALLLAVGVTGCSGDQQADEAVDGADNQAADNDAGGGDNATADANGSGGGAADDNAAGGDGGNAAADAGDGTKADGGNGTENDLQEIITEMNGQPGGDAAKDGANAAPADGNTPAAAPAANAAPAAAPANNSAAAKPAAPQPQADEGPKSTLPFQPGGTPAAPGLPEMGSKMAYVVEKGDTLAKISQKIYGSNGRWQEMATLSGLTNPSRIFPGDLVYYTLDESAVAFAKAYDTVQRSEEQVKPGDTLATIARRLYGSTTAWRSLWRHNDRIDNPDVVTPGTTVYYVQKGALQAAVQKFKKVQAQLAAKSQHKKHAAKALISKVRGVHGQAQHLTKVGKIVKGIHLTGSSILSQLQTVQLTV
jgi:nucleoid-associated protein YgaU